jgi:hypothetical protein
MDHKRLDYVAGYRHEIDYALADGEGPILRKIRQTLSTLDLNNEDAFSVQTDDEIVFTSVLQLDDIAGYLIDDDDTQPIENWWWHLGKIRNRTYPAALLPSHLQLVYSDNGLNVM